MTCWVLWPLVGFSVGHLVPHMILPSPTRPLAICGGRGGHRLSVRFQRKAKRRPPKLSRFSPSD
jgi:hypothetical protein